MADYSGNDWYCLDSSWRDGQWWTTKCFDYDKWRGPLEVLIDTVPKLQRLQIMYSQGVRKGKIVYDPRNKEYILTFPKIKR